MSHFHDGTIPGLPDPGTVAGVYARHTLLNFQLYPCKRCGGKVDYVYHQWWQCRDCGAWRLTITTVGHVTKATFTFYRNKV